MSADQAKKVQHTQTKLILANANLPVNNETEPYASVMQAWVTALEAMNNLVKGIPQRARDGAPLLAVSAWHLYPNMVVYGESCVEVKQKDIIFDSAVFLTLGLEHVREDSKSVYWSLPLACLQYYGHPIQTSRTVGPENSRISYQQFTFVILGCIFDGWKAYATTNEDGLQWVERLATTLGLSTQHQYAHERKPTWLIYVLGAARQFTEFKGPEIIEAQKLMNLGRRWSTYLHSLEDTPPPLFGLSQIDAFLGVLKSDQERVQCLRKLVSHLKLDGSKFYIRYYATTEEDAPTNERTTTKKDRVEYASVIPFRQASFKRTCEGEIKAEDALHGKYIRWILLDSHELLLCYRRIEDIKNVAEAITKLRELEEQEEQEEQKRLQAKLKNSPVDGFDADQGDSDLTKRMQMLTDIQELKTVIPIGQRRLEIENRGELFLPIAEYAHNFDDWCNESRRSYVTSLILSGSLEFHDALRILLDKIGNCDAKRSAIPQFFFTGDVHIAALYCINGLHRPVAKLIPDPAVLDEYFTASNIDTEKVYNHLSTSQPSIGTQIACLRACVMMAEIYYLLPGATISALVLKQSLNKSKWIPETVPKYPVGPQPRLTLPQAFACVAMFESGTCNLNPETLSEVFAMSSGNSLYVARALLCDPFKQPNPTEISRVVGNVGRAGITFLIFPPEVKTRQPDPEQWMAINHKKFASIREDYFRQTSIHLSFTDYEVPLIAEHTYQHAIDRPAVLVETLVSVYDGASWVAEVDVLKAFRSTIYGATHGPSHNEHRLARLREEANAYGAACLENPHLSAVSVENWAELIEAPQTGTIAIQTHKNWLARLAAVAICVKRNFAPVILPEEVCWTCCTAIVPQGTKKFALIC